MKKIIHSLLLIPFLIGCSTIQKGEDPVIVRAEQAAEIGLLTFDTLFLIEYQNREWIDANKPEIKDSVNHLRDYAPIAIKSLRASTKEYAMLKTDVSKSNVIRLTQSVLTGVEDARKMITEIEQKESE